MDYRVSFIRILGSVVKQGGNMLLRELLESPERVHQFFSGQNLDANVRLSASPGEIEVILESEEENQ